MARGAVTRFFESFQTDGDPVWPSDEIRAALGPALAT